MHQDNPTSKNPSSSGKPAISRRDFLKALAVALGNIVLQPILVHAKVFSTFDAPPESSIIVDEDNQIGTVRLDGPPQFWWQRDEESCVGGKMRYTHNTPTPGPIRMNWATWETPSLPVTGEYSIVVYVPLENANTTEAIYKITDGNGIEIFYPVNQVENRGKWVVIGQGIYYEQGQVGSVYVDDVVPEAPDARWVDIGVDAMVWLPPGVTWNPGPNLIAYDPRRAHYGLPFWSGIAGEPVAASLGYFYTQHRDVVVPGPGLSVEFTRAYNSLNTKQGLFGRGWTCLYDMNAQDRGNGEIILTFASGRAGLYVLDGAGHYITPEGFFAKLEKQGDGWLLTETNGTRYKFDSRGKPVEIADPNNNTIKIAYEQNGLGLTDTVGRTFLIENNGDGYIQSITDPLGRVFTYEYDGDRLIKFTDAENGSIQYTYDGEGRLKSITDPNGNTFISNEYDGEGRVINQRDASGTVSTFLYADKQTTFTDNLGHRTIFDFDDQLRLKKETDHLGRSLNYEYDANNNRTYLKDREGHETRMEYDEQGNLLKIIDAAGSESEFQYNDLNKITYKRDASGAESNYQYDSLNFNLTLLTDAEGGQTHMEYFDNGLLKRLINPENNETLFTYDTYGNLQTVTDALGHITPYEHDIAGRRIKVTDANGHTVWFTYDNNDRVRVITDAKGKTTRFEYDAVGNLKSNMDRRGNSTRYEYNVNDSLVRVIDVRGFSSLFEYDLQYHRTKFTNRRGFATRYEYDEVYNLVTTIDARENITRFEYDADHNLTRVIDAKGGVTRNEYDSLHRLKKTINAIGGETSYEYDAVGRVITRRDPNTAETKYQYDQLGRLTQLTDALGNLTRFEYDAVGNREKMINARGFTTDYHYNAINQLIEQIDPLKHTSQWEYDGVGNVLTLTDRRGNKTRFEYDENDNLDKVTDALGGEAIFEYDAEDNRIQATDQNGHTKAFAYDLAGNLLSVQLPLGQVTRFVYDENGNQIQVTNAKGNLTTLDYDPLDLLEQRTTPLGHQTRYQYDELRRMIQMLDAEGNPTGYEYDPLGRMTAVIDALNNVTRYEYDAVGNLTKHVDANNHAIRFDVDLLGRTTLETNPEAKTWSYGYDENGNRSRRVDANNQRTDYEFDGDDRLVRIRYPDGTGVEFEYDPNDNMIGVKDFSGAESFSYDALNRLEHTSRTAKILKNKSVEYAYDAVGNRLSVKYPEMGAVQYQYNENDWLMAVIDPLNSSHKYAYTRDEIGLPTRLDYPNSTWADYVYDRDDRLVRQFNGKPKASTDIISSFEYTLDKVGNRRRTVEQFTRGQAVTWTKDYEYDATYRLLMAIETPDKRPYQVLTSKFEYDAVGNRLQQITNIADKPNTPALPAARTTRYSYDRANRLLNAGETTFSYDDNGNRTSMNGTERAIEYRYDHENRLTGAQTYAVLNRRRNPDATLDFTYDGLGRRRERGVSERGVRKTADYLYDGLGYDLLAEYVQPGSPRATHYYRDPMQVLSRHEIPGGSSGLQYFYHYDGLGSVSAWTNQSGRETQEYTYAPYGRLIDNNGPDNASNRTDPHNSLAFSGKLWDKETETYHFGARDYDPAVGVWLTQDPYRGQLNEPMTRHRYGYVKDNPVNWVDRYGFSEQWPIPVPGPTPTPRLQTPNYSAPACYAASTYASTARSTVMISGSLLSSKLKCSNGGTYFTGCGYTMSCAPVEAFMSTFDVDEYFSDYLKDLGMATYESAYRAYWINYAYNNRISVIRTSPRITIYSRSLPGVNARVASRLAVVESQGRYIRITAPRAVSLSSAVAVFRVGYDGYEQYQEDSNRSDLNGYQRSGRISMTVGVSALSAATAVGVGSLTSAAVTGAVAGAWAGPVGAVAGFVVGAGVGLALKYAWDSNKSSTFETVGFGE